MGLARSFLRRQLWWLVLREVQREGLVTASRRLLIQRAIDDTPPVPTDAAGHVEVRVLTWRRDWRNVIWALKSFYAYSGVRYPLYLHDGGWLPKHARQLQRHFPNAVLVSAEEANDRVERILQERGYERSLMYRRKNSLTRQLFDFFLLSKADYVIIIGSDILFFRRPTELLVPPHGIATNFYAKDSGYFYSMTLDELEQNIGVRPPPSFNTGPSLVRRSSVDFDLIERCLHQPKLFEDNWVTEQTLHAVCGSVYGADYLPDTYAVEPLPGDAADLACRHYPGLFRHRMYEEGMPYLLNKGFMQHLNSTFGRHAN